MKRTFFQTAVVSILRYGCTTWTQTKRLEKKLDGNYTRMLQAVLNKSWLQNPTKHQLYDCSTLPLICTLSCRVLSKEQSSTIFNVFAIGYRSYGNQTWSIKWNALSSRQRSYRYCCMDALLGRSLNGWRRSWTATTQECCEQ